MSQIGDAEFQVGGKFYRSARMGVFDQQTVASVLGTVLMVLGGPKDAPATDDAAGVTAKPAKPRKEPTDDEFVRAFCALSGDIRKMDSDMVLGLCMSGVSRAEGPDAPYAKVYDRVQNAWFFQDIDLREMLLIVWNVLKQHRIPDFFSAPDTSSAGAKAVSG